MKTGGFKTGIVTDVDNAKALVRVKFPEMEIVSDWLPVLVMRAKTDQFFNAMVINEHVICLMDENCEDGVVVGCIYDETNVPVGAGDGKHFNKFSDGTEIIYDSVAKKLTINAAGNVEIVAATASKITVNSGDLEIEADNLKVTGNIKATGEVTAKFGTVPVSLSTHTHAYTAAPPGVTAGPTPGT
jgi:phage baseplate assembly protein V